MINEQPSPHNAVGVTGDLDLRASETELHFADGRMVRLPTALLSEQWQMPTPTEADGMLIPLIEEQLQVGKRVIETGKVELHKSAESYDVTLDESLVMNTWQVERVVKHEVVEQIPPTRQEGETAVYPIVEERLVLTKELVLVEEVRVTRSVFERRDTRTVPLRRETMSVKRETLDQL